MKVKFYYGDCLNILPTLPADSADMSFNDVPYGTTACKWDSVIPFKPMWKGVERVVKNNGANIFTGSEPFSSALRMSNIKHYKYDWYWIKSQAVGHLNAYKMPMKNVEVISVFYKSTSLYNPSLSTKPKENIRPPVKNRKVSNCYGAHSKNAERKIPINKTLPSQVLFFNNCQDNLHPTQKPVELIEYMIKTYSNEGATILDITAGSGPTGIAAINTNRNALLIEKAPLWYNIGCMRLGNVPIPEIKKYRNEQRDKYGKEADFKAALLFPEVMEFNG